MGTSRFNPQIEMMIGLAISRLRYPEWYDINKKSTDNEDEERFQELRADLIEFL